MPRLAYRLRLALEPDIRAGSFPTRALNLAPVAKPTSAPKAKPKTKTTKRRAGFVTPASTLSAHRRTSERRQLGNMASGIYNLVMQISRGYDRPIIEVTEEGCSYREAPCEQENERVPDGRCIQFFREHLAELARAISEGANVRTYDARSLLDNFEWADGYTPALRSHLCGFSRSEAHDKGLRAVVRARRWCELLGRVVHLRSILSANCNAERYRT